MFWNFSSIILKFFQSRLAYDFLKCEVFLNNYAYRYVYLVADFVLPCKTKVGAKFFIWGVPRSAMNPEEKKKIVEKFLNFYSYQSKSTSQFQNRLQHI